VTLPVALLVALGAALGAPARYAVDALVQSRYGPDVPWGTFTVNVAGSLVLGAVAGAVDAGGPPWLVDLVGVGFSGALTTFSTFSLETVRLVEDARLRTAAGYVAASVAVGLAVAVLGYAGGSALLGG